MKELKSVRIGIIGLGYVGMPLAVAFAEKYPCVGFDINPQRIEELRNGWDRTREVTEQDLHHATNLELTDQLPALQDCNVYIVTVPTPIDVYRRPDLGPLLGASRAVGQVLAKGDVVIYESTVYPGATEEDCVPVLEQESGLRLNSDFYVGYSPERINPGDHQHRVCSIMKITSGSTSEAADFVDALYASIITAGTHRTESIRVAEAAKVIENTQRDVNIALINEFAMLFNSLGIDTQAVLRAAGTKWNFLPFSPGLVGGHCIGVDPYYLTHKAQQMGCHPEMILAGRRTNDGMGAYIAAQVIKLMASRSKPVAGGRVLLLGLTFKENTPDIRNTRVVDIIRELRDFNAQVDVYDPLADPTEALQEYDLNLIQEIAPGGYDAVILAVGHQEFRNMGIGYLRDMLTPGGVVYDIKHVFPAEVVDGRL